ncbi:MAG: efflux RND transporter periplasmic adaptor subunit [Planctomycetota bacterium]
MIKSRFIASVLFLFCIGLLTSCSKQEAPKSKAAQIPKVTVAQPGIEKVERIISAVGTLEAEDQVQVTTEVSGIINEIKFEEGDEIKQGDVLAILNQTSFKLNVENSRALLERARTNLALADSNYKRRKDLYDKKFITEQELQELANALDKAKAEYDSAQVVCKISQKALQDSVIKAPVDVNNKDYIWEVQRKLVSIGDFVNPGKPVVELVNRMTLKLRFTAPEQDAGYLIAGKKVNFSVPAISKKEFEGDIFYISPAAVENTRVVIVKARLNNTERILRPGYSANVRFIAEAKENAFTIQRRSLRFDVDKTYVYVVKDKKLERKDVTTGVQTEDFVEITSGITADDEIVVRSGTFVEAGTLVEVISEK